MAIRDELVRDMDRLRAQAKMVNALYVVALDPRIVAYLTDHDPKALQQVDEALEAAEQFDLHETVRARIAARKAAVAQ